MRRKRSGRDDDTREIIINKIKLKNIFTTEHRSVYLQSNYYLI